MSWMASDRHSGKPPIALALQGGGAYGAFTWGVLDRILEDSTFVPAAISGASAGAVNAVITASGYLDNGTEGARTALRTFWSKVGQMSPLSPMSLPGAAVQFDLLTRVLSPYQFNPLNINPLRDMLTESVDFARLRQSAPFPLFISASDVTTGRPRIFRAHELSIDVLMASACIPYVSQAVSIDGRSYWDGGFTSNPPILPMVKEVPCRTLWVIKLTPDEEPALPTAAKDIFGRLKRILFNAPVLHDLDALGEMQAILRRTSVLSADLRRLRDLYVREIAIDNQFFASAHDSALNPNPDFLRRLYGAGRHAAYPESLTPPTSSTAQSTLAGLRAWLWAKTLHW